MPLRFNHETESMEPATVSDIPIPNFWAPFGEVKKLWKEVKSKFNIQHSLPDKDAHHWDAREWLKYVLEKEQFSKHMVNTNKLEIIVRGDCLKAGDRSTCFLIATLGNIGDKEKCVGYNLLLNLAEVSNKNREEVRDCFHHNFQILSN